MGRHPGLLPFGNSAFGTPHHTTPHHTTPHHTTPHHTTPHHTTPHHTTPVSGRSAAESPQGHSHPCHPPAFGWSLLWSCCWKWSQPLRPGARQIHPGTRHEVPGDTRSPRPLFTGTQQYTGGPWWWHASHSPSVHFVPGLCAFACRLCLHQMHWKLRSDILFVAGSYNACSTAYEAACFATTENGDLIVYCNAFDYSPNLGCRIWSTYLLGSLTSLANPSPTASYLSFVDGDGAANYSCLEIGTTTATLTVVPTGTPDPTTTQTADSPACPDVGTTQSINAGFQIDVEIPPYTCPNSTCTCYNIGASHSLFPCPALGGHRPMENRMV